MDVVPQQPGAARKGTTRGGTGRRRLAAVAVLVAVGLAQAADLITFLRLMFVRGPGAELNPIVRGGVTDLGLAPLVLAKVALIVLVVATFVIVIRTRARLGLLIATAGTTAGLVGAFSNVISF
jgi:hypothetical protein